MKRDLVLRDYQEPAAEYIKTSDRCVLAIAPNGGKTEISIRAIENYLQENQNGRVLVLTHSTNVLLGNYYDRLEDINVSFTYSKTFDINAQVHICLPNNESNISSKYDFVIVDEAHENYLATRVQRIITTVEPKKELLLTGTPSKFIREGGYDIYVIAANEISDKWFAKLNIELVASNYNWVGNYNNDQEVLNNFNFGIVETQKTLEDVMVKLIQRLKTGFDAEQFNHPSFVTKLKKWAFTYNNIGKTMIMCKTIEHAEATFSILKKHDVNCAISHSECDVDSNVLKEFKDNKYDVIVVVNRGRLGYNDDDLMNLIDMSGSHNPNMIYQAFCRVVRGTPDIEKYYLKVTPKELHNMSLTWISVCAALMLTDRKYLMEYNGRNFNDFEIPVLRRPRPVVNDVDDDIDTEEGDDGDRERATRRRNNRNLLPEFTHDIIDTFKNILHNLENPVSIYKKTTIGDVRYKLGHTDKRPPMSFEELLNSARGYSLDEV
jgi:superfamily II DNA or RNA helicase